MTEDRKNTIIDELHYWKKNKMLPAVYCDYLLALYSNMDEVEDEQEKSRENTVSLVIIGELVLLFLLLPFALLTVYSTIFLDSIQVAILLIFIFYSFWQRRELKFSRSILKHLSLAILLLLLFLLTVFLSNTYVVLTWSTNLVIIINFVSWFILGRKLNLKYLQVAGILGILLVGVVFVL